MVFHSLKKVFGMRNKIQIKKTRFQLFYGIMIFVTVIFVIGSVLLCFHEIADSDYIFFNENLTETFFSNNDPISCTIFTVSHGKKVFFGNNEDWKNPKTYYWTTPSGNGKYGVLYLGFDNLWPQGGINEKGLAFDVNALPTSHLNHHPELPKVRTPFYDFLKTCATVDEIIEKVKSYSWERSWKAQLHVADRLGNAVVISADQNGEIAFTRKGEYAGYLVSTNYNLANPENGKFPCWRFNTTSKMFGKIEHDATPTLDYLRSILDAVHVEGAYINTVYSNIFDLTNGIIYLYHWHNYNEVVELKVANEVASEITPVPLKNLFSQNTIDQTSNEYLEYRKKITFWKTVAWIWIFLCGASVIILLNELYKVPPPNIIIGIAWILVATFFGPFGLAAYFYAYRQFIKSFEKELDSPIWIHAFGKTIFDITGYTIGMAAAMATFYLILPFNESTLWSIVARCYGFPLIIGVCFLLISTSASIKRDRYRLIFRRSIIFEFISFHLALVGIFPVSGFLLDLTERLIGMDGPSDPVFWCVLALGGLTATFLVYPLNLWIAHHRKGHL